MAIKYLSASANLSAATWLDAPAGSPTTAPGVGDNADLNGKTLTVDQNFTCDNIVGAGTLTPSGTRTINANLGDSSSSWTMNVGANTLTVNGNIVGPNAANPRITLNSASSILTVNGNVTGGTTSTNARGILTSTNGSTLTISGTLTGNAGNAVRLANTGTFDLSGVTAITGGATSSVVGLSIAAAITVSLTVTLNNTNAPAIDINNASAVVTITGNLSAGTNGFAVVTMTNGTVTINGNITAGSVSNAVGLNASNGTVVVNGNVTGGSGAATANQGLVMNGAVTATINGTVTGGSATGATSGNSGPFGIYMANSGSAALTINGSIADGTTSSALMRASGSFTYNPGASDTLVAGGKTMYPTTGGAPYNAIRHQGQDGVMAA